MYHSKIAGLGYYVPENVVTNDDLSKIMDTNDEWIQERTGIQERRHIIRGEDTTTSMGVKAAEIAIYDFRSAVMGRMTLETPEEFAVWLAAGEKLDAERQVKKDAIELDRKIRFKKIPRPDSRAS